MAGLAGGSKSFCFQETVQIVRAIRAGALDVEWFKKRFR
jgi:hypothetical protein